MKGENLVHLKFEYLEALTGKREILYSEKVFVNLMNVIKKYSTLRSDELRLKLKLHRKTKELIRKIKQLNEHFPHINVEKILNHDIEKNEEIKQPEKIIKVKKEPEPENEIEAQLRDIQRKLNAISG